MTSATQIPLNTDISSPFGGAKDVLLEGALQGSDAKARSALRLALIPGDGIGPEVMQALPRLLAWAQGQGLSLNWETFPFGADHFLATGESLSEGSFEHLRSNFDAIFFGAIGDPRIPDGRHADALLLRLRRDLELGVNFRPNRPLPQHFSPLRSELQPTTPIEVFRENTEGAYVLRGHRNGQMAVDEAWHSGGAIDRLLACAFARAQQRGCRLVLAHKGNVLKFGHGLWLERFQAMRSEFPSVAAEAIHADALLCALVQSPGAFPLIAADNFLGDLISDLLAGLHGGMGLAPSASWAPHRPFRCRALFEPVHGSAPTLAGKDLANPMGAFASLALLFRWAGWSSGATRLEEVLDRALLEGPLTPDLGGDAKGSAMADWIVAGVLD